MYGNPKVVLFARTGSSEEGHGTEDSRQEHDSTHRVCPLARTQLRVALTYERVEVDVPVFGAMTDVNSVMIQAP